MKYRLFALVLIAALSLSGCGILPNNNDPDVPTPAPTEDLSGPDGVAQAFLNAWTQGNYSGMYSLLSPNSQAEYSETEFIDTYTSTANTMSLIDLQVVPMAILQETSESALFAFKVTYNTTILGSIEEEISMPLVYENSRWGVSWSPGLIFDELSKGSTLQLESESPSRANIYDRNGLWLVSANAEAITLQIVPGQVSDDYEGQMLDMLSQMLRIPPNDIRKNYEGLPEDWYVALGDVDLETFNEFRNEFYSYPGLDAYEKNGRRYYYSLAPHIMGHTGYIPVEKLEEYQALGYQGGEIVGLSGLELWGEEYLAGKKGGVLGAYTVSGIYLEVAASEPQPAQSIYTTLDRDLQTIVQDAVEEAYRYSASTWAPTSHGAAVVVMDVNNGDILAAASYPSFDPNVLNPNNNHPLATEGYLQDLASDPDTPFLNRVSQGQYPPGSVWKIVSMATALESGVLEPDSLYTCTGVWDGLGPENLRYDWKEDGHGTLTLVEGLTASCNPYFYQIGYLTGQQDFNLIPNYAHEFGFGTDQGFLLPEEPGFVPTTETIMQSSGHQWTIADSVNVAIGQGDVQVTPLQIVTMISAIANGGTLYRPQIVDRIGLIGEEPTVVYEPEITGSLPVSEEHLDAIRQGMRGVASNIEIGTAEGRIGGMQIAVAGKTGTAQVPLPGTPPHAWFAGYAPFDDPEIAVVVLVENSGQGSDVASPIFRRIVEEYYGLRVFHYPNDWANPDLFNFVTDSEAVQ